MKVTIETARNGWLIRREPDELDETTEVFVYGFSNDGDDVDEVKSFASFLWRITELLGPTTSRYSEARIYIEVKPGDKYIDGIDELQNP